jgi:RND family efflux transporter MFP subunit
MRSAHPVYVQFCAILRETPRVADIFRHQFLKLCLSCCGAQEVCVDVLKVAQCFLIFFKYIILLYKSQIWLGRFAAKGVCGQVICVRLRQDARNRMDDKHTIHSTSIGNAHLFSLGDFPMSPARTVVFGFALLLLFGQPLLAQGRPAGVTTEVVVAQNMSETVAVFGQIIPARESDVAARVMGVVTEVHVRIGDAVTAGAILARLDTERLEIEVQQAQAESAITEAGIVVAQTRLDRAETALRRTESLAASSTASQAQLDDRAGLYAEALASFQQARARRLTSETVLRRAEYNLNNADVRAPFAGVVLDVPTEVGQFIQTGNVVARILDVATLEVEANVPSRYIQALQKEVPVVARTDGGDTLTLALRAVLPTEFTSTRTRPVRFDLNGDVGMVAAGQSVTLDLPVSAPREMLVVPKDALVQANGGWRVFVNAEGKASPRTVSIGAAIGGGFAVLSGLTPGDEVVVRGNERLRPGQSISTGSGRAGGGGWGGGSGRPSAEGSGRPASGTEGRPGTTSSGRPSEGSRLGDGGIGRPRADTVATSRSTTGG